MKNYLIIGGSSGIGKAIVQQLTATVNRVFVLQHLSDALSTLIGDRSRTI